MSVAKRYTKAEVLEYIRELADREGVGAVAKRYGLWQAQLSNIRSGDKPLGPVIAKRFGFIEEERLYRREG